eukprot:TRINITY_DN1689_c0_g1_i2.p2 TRINITY_DN1689_c0_g1~~TRINITY_DN1689_c0_g1_i2.p2  ORF type:complete len:224 (+),score=42.53 TRINITY_DN1689_c0_g1_i2:561-1232(+)
MPGSTVPGVPVRGMGIGRGPIFVRHQGHQIRLLDGYHHSRRGRRDGGSLPGQEIAAQMQDLIIKLAEEGDSVGGVVTCAIYGVPVGLGEPCFDKLEALLAHAMLSIPATKGFEIGSGFAGTKLRGSEHNDAYVKKGDRLGTATNNSGGVQGGISNGEPIVLRIAFKPPATIAKGQQTCTIAGQEETLAAKGRHDPCVVNRAVPIVEAMASITILDAYLQQKQR